MNATAEICPALAGQDSFLDRLARRGLMAGLARLTEGSLTVSDSQGTRRFAQNVEPGFDVRVDVHNPRFYRRTALGGSLAAAESYLDGDWSCNDLTVLFRLLIRNPQTITDMDRGPARLTGWLTRVLHYLRRNTPDGSRRNIEAHYDLGNDFFRLFLDETLMYSSGIFRGPDSTLNEASLEKLDVICRQLDLSPRDHLLEIGTGWGGFALHAAGQYGCRVTTTTISREQFELARDRIARAGLDQQVTVLLKDYRDLEGRYDKLVSIEMIEAVGHQYLSAFFRQCGRLLAPDGLMLLQSIVMNERVHARYLKSVDFIQKYIFPGGCLPSVLSLGQAIARASDLQMLRVEDFGPHYARTLRCWRERFHAELEAVRRLGYSERFIRMWEYYLCYCEAAFEERQTGVVQMLLAKPESRCELLPGGPAGQLAIYPSSANSNRRAVTR